MMTRMPGRAVRASSPLRRHPGRRGNRARQAPGLTIGLDGVAARSESSAVSGAVNPAWAEAQLNPSIDSASAQPRERVEVLLQLLGVKSMSSWRVEATTPVLPTGKNPGIASHLQELPSEFILLAGATAERRETFGCSAEHPWGVHITRHARRLRGALRPMRGTLASRRSTVAVLGSRGNASVSFGARRPTTVGSCLADPCSELLAPRS